MIQTGESACRHLEGVPVALAADVKQQIITEYGSAEGDTGLA